ncbi:MAG: hypothetical protein ACI97K_001565 [Glaciecola sp.]|jgi:hypothetical protein
MKNNQSENNDHDELGSLWREQTEMNLNLNEIKKLADSQRWKQRFYIFMDLLSLTPFLLILFFKIELSLTLQVFIALCFVLSIIIIIYFIKLRWASAFSHQKSTEDFTKNLLVQLHNNARIAYINKHSAWIITIAVLIFISFNAWFMGWDGDKAFSGLLAAALLSLLLFVPWYIWANKRQIRFEKEAQSIKDLLSE